MIARTNATVGVTAVVTAALALDLLLAATTAGSGQDISAMRGAGQTMLDDPLHVYTLLRDPEGDLYWPYPPGFLPVCALLVKFAQGTGIAFETVARFPQIAAALAMALLVQWHLGFRGAGDSRRVAAAALVALSPVMVAVVGMHGQLDPVQWLPAVAAIVAWERLPAGRRAPVAGALVGLGIAIKTVPGIVMLALLPLARDNRERIILVVAAAIVPAAALAPFLLVDGTQALDFRHYQSIPGQGGLSLIVQPELALLRFAGQPIDGLSDLQQALQDITQPAVLAALALTTWRLMVTRPDPALGTVLLILAVLVAGANVLTPYLTYPIAFLALAGHWRYALALNAAALIPLLFLYAPKSVRTGLGLGDQVYDTWAVWAFYIPASIVLWLLLAGGWIAGLRRLNPSSAA